MATVKLEHVSKSFGPTPVIRDMNLMIEDGEFLVFVGPSGCGKSTLLRMIAGLDSVSSGDIWIGDDRVTTLAPSNRGVSMVFQSYALYPHMTTYKNIAFGLTLSKTAKETIDERVRRVAEMLRIEPLLDRKPHHLSGGQRQRVAIARAIVREPRVFLFDEPLSNLDAALRAQTRVEIMTLHDTLGATMIYVTHDQVEAMTLADRIVVMNHGHIEQIGPPAELYHQPATLFVAEFLGSPRMNVFPVTVRDGVAVLASGDEVRLPEVRLTEGETSRRLSAATRMGVRAEDLHLVHGADASRENCLLAHVTLVEELGETRLVHATLRDGIPLVFRDRSEPPPLKGHDIVIRVDRDRYHAFDAAGNRIALG
jgi:ABC-type sugar transport system ATPase subunit